MALISCLTCGNELNAKAATCARCGGTLSGQRRGHRWLVGVCYVAVVIVFGVVCYRWLQRQ